MSKEKPTQPNIWKVFRNTLNNLTTEPKPSEIELTISPSACNSLHELATRPNPRLSEAAFIGLGSKTSIDDIIMTSSGFSPNSGLFQNGFLGSSVDEHELEQLVNFVIKSGKVKKIKMLGHTHPTGALEINGVKFTSSPNDKLLEPSGGYDKLTSKGDLAFYKAFRLLNPTYDIPYAAILANTPEGQKLRVYDMDQLTKIKTYSALNRVPQTTIKV